MYFKFLLYFLILFPYNGYGNSSQINFRHINTKQGLSNNQVHSIFKDHKGYVWIGTMAGLNRYDGYNFKVYKHNPQDSASLRDNFVLKILEDQEEYLWILSRNSSLCFYNPTKDIFIEDRPLLRKNIPIPCNNISDINKDSKGRIWVNNDFFGIYIYDFNSDSVTYIKHIPDQENSILSNNICSMAEDTEGNFWIVNQQGIIEKLNRESLLVEKRVSIFSGQIDHNENFRLFVDKDNDVWVYSESKSLGIKQYSESDKRIYYYSSESNNNFKINNNTIKDIVQDKNGLIYIGMDHGGLNIINKDQNLIYTAKNTRGETASLPDNSITTLYYDNTGIVWIGMYKSGIAYYHPDFFKFKNFENNPFKPNSLQHNDINCFAENTDGNIYIGTNGGGLIRFDEKSGLFKEVPINKTPSSNSNKGIIMSLLCDSKDRLWIGTYLDGLKLIDNDKIIEFKHEPNNQNSISNDWIWQVFEDSRHNIWIGTLGSGVDLWNPTNNTFKHFNININQSIGSNYIYSIEEDQYGNIWFGTIYGVYVLNWENQLFTQHLNAPNNLKTLSNNKILIIKSDSRGWIWIGTSDGLNLYDKNTKSFRRFRKEDGLPDNAILSIEEDQTGNLWLGTTNGLANFIIKNVSDIWNFDYYISNYNESDGLLSRSFNERASFKTNSGQLLFGSTNGFSSFHPQSINASAVNINPILSQFELFNEIVGPGDIINGRKILDKTIFETQELNLKHNENFFSISFTALDFFHPNKLLYQYKLDGFNDSWFIANPSNRKAIFTNLSYGTYTFRVRVSEDGKNWSKKEATLLINILPPIWATKWAITIYVILVFIFILILRRTTLRKERLKHQRENEKKEIIRQEELTQLKIKFFTNISHEFRTPLTLIISPLKNIINNTPDDSQKKQLTIVEKNANRLLSLVNQLLDFRKMEVNQLSINPSIGDIILFIKDKVESFDSFSQDKSIKLHYKSDIEALQCLFDHDKLEKIIFNLLSNAFKFTPENGTISINLTTKIDEKSNIPKDIILKVEDSGIGISPAKLDQIFERFFQDDKGKTSEYNGSGIGLALTKEYVQLHGGKISVSSEVGRGSCFTVQIPIHSKTSAEITPATTPAKEAPVHIPNEICNKVEEGQKKQKPTILIVEDNDDLRFYLQENLRNNYNTIEASNGEHALNLVENNRVDLIVSDVMMPIVGGIEFCTQLKQDKRYSHIPIILLTARTTDEQKLEGLKAGADDYITKPFSYEILEVKIQNIIKYRKSLQSTFITSDNIKPSDICVTTIDEKLFQKALDVVEENLGNSDFSIEKMSELMGISRAHLYNKLMAITGKTPADFIKIMRLKRAAQLIEKSQMTISEISYEVGYNGPRYFTRHFKDYYGVTPSKYTQSKNASNNP